MLQPLGSVPSVEVDFTVAPCMNQNATVRLGPSYQRMSALPSPSKSPVPATAQRLGTLAIVADETICTPFMNQMATSPAVSRHNRSSRPDGTPKKPLSHSSCRNRPPAFVVRISPPFIDRAHSASSDADRYRRYSAQRTFPSRVDTAIPPDFPPP